MYTKLSIIRKKKLFKVVTRGVAWGGTLELQSHLIRKKERKFLLFIFFCFLSLSLTINLLDFQVLRSIFKYSVNFIGAASLKLGILHYKHLQTFLYKT